MGAGSRRFKSSRPDQVTQKMKAPKHLIISKEDAAFRLNQNGKWINQSGEFQHKKIIDYFHASIRKDKNGYHLYQEHGDRIEKVYFYYEDTALFVFDIVAEGNDMMLVLNTGKKIKLQPENLFIKDDHLYMNTDDDRIKFTERTLTQISKYIDSDGDHYYWKNSGLEILIPVE